MNRNFVGVVGWGKSYFGKEKLFCAREVCSSHCPFAHIAIHPPYTNPSIKPISFAQGMGTPLISLLPLSSLFLHIISVLSLTLSPPVLSLPSFIFFPLHFITSSPCPALTLSVSLVPPPIPRGPLPSKCLHLTPSLFPAFHLCPVYPPSIACVFPQ